MISDCGMWHFAKEIKIKKSTAQFMLCELFKCFFPSALGRTQEKSTNCEFSLWNENTQEEMLRDITVSRVEQERFLAYCFLTVLLD